jgi:hypothetical protein
MSFVEAIANVVVGFLLAVLTQIVVFPLLGLRASVADNLALGAIFTAVSIVRSFTYGSCSKQSAHDLMIESTCEGARLTANASRLVRCACQSAGAEDDTGRRKWSNQ